MLKVNQKYNYEKNKIEEKKIILELTRNYIRNYGPESLAKKIQLLFQARLLVKKKP